MTLCWYFVGGLIGVTWGYAAIDFAQLAIYLQLSRRAVFFRPLAFACFLSITIQAAASLAGLGAWWTAFILNRLFELTLAYIITCSIFRIIRAADKKRGALHARPDPQSLLRST